MMLETMADQTTTALAARAGATTGAAAADDAGQATAEEWQRRFAEDSPENPEPNYKQISQVLGSVKTERITFRPDLHDELRAAKEQVIDHGGYRDLVKAIGVPRTALVECGGIGLSRIATRARYFAPVDPGNKKNRLSVIMPVWDGPGGDLIDLLAVRLDQPAQFYVRSGYARCLGEWNIAEVIDNTTLWALPNESPPSLVLAPDPLKWLQSDCQGACILHKIWLDHLLAGIRAVTAYNEAHAALLHKLFVWPDAPKIYLRKKSEAA